MYWIRRGSGIFKLMDMLHQMNAKNISCYILLLMNQAGIEVEHTRMQQLFQRRQLAEPLT